MAGTGFRSLHVFLVGTGFPPRRSWTRTYAGVGPESSGGVGPSNPCGFEGSKGCLERLGTRFLGETGARFNPVGSEPTPVRPPLDTTRVTSWDCQSRGAEGLRGGCSSGSTSEPVPSWQSGRHVTCLRMGGWAERCSRERRTSRSCRGSDGAPAPVLKGGGGVPIISCHIHKTLDGTKGRTTSLHS